MFSPYAWAKLVYLRDLGPTEIGGFGITNVLNPLLVIDFRLIRQLATPVTVAFDDTAVADFFDAQVDQGFVPQQFARIWIHTHPGRSPQPSRTDEETFTRVFAECDWAVMFILARSEDDYARLRFNAGPGGDIDLRVGIDYRAWFPGSNTAAWEAEYHVNVIHDRTPTLTDWPELWPSHAAELESHGRSYFHNLYDGEILACQNLNDIDLPVHDE